MRFGFYHALTLGLLLISPSLHAGDCDDDPTITPFVRALQADPKNLDDMYNLAIAYYKRVTSADPSQPDPCLDNAISSMRHFVKAAAGTNVPDKTLADGYGVLGILEFQFKGEASDGLGDFQKALKYRSDDKDSTFGAALAEMKLGNNKEASDYFKKTILLDPDNVTAHYNYATSLNTIDGDHPTPAQSAELKSAFEGTASAGRGNASANKDILLVTYNRLADLYAKSDEVPKAIDVLNRAIALEPNDYNAHFQLGLMYHLDKNYLKMVEEYEKAIQIEPNAEDARYNLAAAYTLQEEYAKAYEQFAYITDNINKGNSEVLALQAQTLDKAIDELKSAGTAAFTAEDYFTAKTNFEEVLKLDPRDKTAEKYLDDANKQIESKFAEYVKTADKFAARGKKTDAAEYYDKALSLKPDDEDIKKKSKKLGADISLLVNRYINDGDAAAARGDNFTAEDFYNRADQFKQGKTRAEAHLKKLGDKFKGDFQKKMRAGKNALSNDSLAAARTAFKAALVIKPGDREASAGLVAANTKIEDKIKRLTAQASSASGKAEQTRLYNKILALDPNNQDAGDHIKSLTGTEAKAKVNADQIKALYYQGVDYYVNNNIKQAIATWEKLLVLDPGHEDAIKNIARAKTKLNALAQLSNS